MALDYAAACKAAADRQGVTAIADALAAVGIDTDIDQTGGFTMVGVVRRDDGMVLTLTDDSPLDDAAELLVGENTVARWYEECEPEIRYWVIDGYAALVAHVQHWLAGDDVSAGAMS
jgi:hypothetical protein